MIQRIINIFTNPSKAFTDAKEKPMILSLLIVLMVISLVTGIINYLDGTSLDEIQRTNLELGANMPLDQMQSQALITSFVGPFALPIGLIFVAGMIHLGVLLFGGQGYKNTYGIVVHTTFIGTLSSTLAFIVLKLTDISIVFNPMMFLDASNMSGILTTTLELFDIFTIWSFAVTFIALRIIYNFNKKEAAIATSIPYLLSYALLIVVNIIV